MKKLALFTAAALTATLGSAAFAQDNTSDFQKADGNKDGLISWEEAMVVSSTLTEELYKQADANGDGSLDEAEFQSLQTLVGPDDNAGDSSSSSAQ